MKPALSVAAATLVLASAVTVSPLWAAPVPSRAVVKPKRAAIKVPVRVTRDNFVSLSWQQTGGFAGIRTSLDLEGNTLSYSTGRPNNADTAPQTRRVSNLQLDSLIAQLNKANVPALVGDYRQPNLADGFNEVLVLTISDRNDRDQQYTIQNYGDRAPRGYYAFVASFRKLAGTKFPNSPFAPAPSTPTGR